MSIDTSHVALANEQQLQQMIGNPDPRLSIPAAARLAKLIQTRKAQQNNAAMAEQVPPTVKDQLAAAAAPPPPTGIAQAAPGMAEGGMVQRHFEDGGEADTSPFAQDAGNLWDKFIYKSTHNPESPEELAQQRAARDYREANRGPSGGEEIAAWIKNYFGKPKDVAAAQAADAAAKDQVPYAAQPSMDLNQQAAARIARQGSAGTAPTPSSGLDEAAQAAARTKRQTGSAGIKAATSSNAPRAIDQAGGSGELSPSGPVNPTKIAAASKGAAPEETYRDRAEALQAQLDPLYAEQMAHIKRQGDAENERYSGLQAAQKKDGWRQLSDLGAQMMESTKGPTHGIADLARFGKRYSDDKLKQDTAAEDQRNKHQIVLDGVAAGATKEQIGQAIAKYNLINHAVGADDKTELNDRNATIREQQLELNRTRADETARLNNARIQKLVSGSKGSGLGAAGGKPLTEAQALQHAAAAASKDIKAIQDAGGDVPDRAQLTAAYYAKFKALTHTGAVQSAPAPAAPGASPGWGQIQRN
jgi:hypothetical protein